MGFVGSFRVARCSVFLAWVLALCSLPSWGQSLGELARKEKERRQKTPPGKVYTDKDLARPGTETGTFSVSPPATSSPPAEEPAHSPSRTVTVRVPGPPAEQSPIRTLPSDEAYWRRRLAEAKQRVRIAEERVRELEGESARQISQDIYGPHPCSAFLTPGVLTTEQQKRLEECRARVVRERSTVVARLERAKGELAAAKQALENLGDEARRAGALPGWIRE